MRMNTRTEVKRRGHATSARMMVSSPASARGQEAGQGRSSSPQRGVGEQAVDDVCDAGGS